MKDYLFSALEPGDIERITDLQPEGWADIRIAARYFIQSPNCQPIKVTQGNRIIGLGNSLLHTNTAWLAAIIVHRDYRNQGLGLYITQTLVNAVKNKVETIYLDATEFGYPVYTKLGFEVETEYLHFKGTTQPSSLISEFIGPFKPEYSEQVLALDRLVSGEDRHFIINEQIGQALVYAENKRVSGVFFPTLRDGFIIAANDPAGIALMKLRLKTFDNAIFPKDNQAAHNYIHALGFTFQRSSKRMRLGKERPWQAGRIYNRISGQLG